MITSGPVRPPFLVAIDTVTASQGTRFHRGRATSRRARVVLARARAAWHTDSVVSNDAERINRAVADRMAKLRSTRANGAPRLPALSQAQLAEILGVSRATVANIENRRQRVPIWYVYAICAKLGEDVDAVMPSVSEIQHAESMIQARTSRLDVAGESHEIEDALLRELAPEFEMEVDDAGQESENR